jgi:hypothetical protein
MPITDAPRPLVSRGDGSGVIYLAYGSASRSLAGTNRLVSPISGPSFQANPFKEAVPLVTYYLKLVR